MPTKIGRPFDGMQACLHVVEDFIRSAFRRRTCVVAGWRSRLLQHVQKFDVQYCVFVCSYAFMSVSDVYVFCLSNTCIFHMYLSLSSFLIVMDNEGHRNHFRTTW